MCTPLAQNIDALCDGVANCDSGNDETSPLCESELIQFGVCYMSNQLFLNTSMQISVFYPTMEVVLILENVSHLNLLSTVDLVYQALLQTLVILEAFV